MTNNTNTPIFNSHAERLAYYSNADSARLDAPIMPKVVNRPAPRPRRNSVPHRAIR
jgi:hypothetical protein